MGIVAVPIAKSFRDQWISVSPGPDKPNPKRAIASMLCIVCIVGPFSQRHDVLAIPTDPALRLLSRWRRALDKGTMNKQCKTR